MCNGIKWSFAAAYIALLAVGLLSANRDHSSGSLLIVLGIPWTLFLDSLVKVDALSGVSPSVLRFLAPAINSAILFSMCSSLRRRRTLSGNDT
jgi:hypothetical protein